MPGPATPFHPIVDAWFAGRFGAATAPQALGWPHILAGGDALIAAPTGSGKTLAAFLSSIDFLLRQALDGRLADEVQTVYVSPLKALSNDIRRNLEGPLSEIAQAAAAQGLLMPPLRAMVRTGDTPASQRAAMLKHPPHILVTTPESLYLLLTSPGGRKILAATRTVIVDEIHALARDKRGSHLALSLERLAALCDRPPQRIGLSATQKPIEEIARFLVGARRVDAEGRPACRIVDTGHSRELDLGLELPASPLAAVCGGGQWEEVDKRLEELISSHRSTLVFVNTRRMAERVSHRLRERLGEDAVASHHGSLSRELRLSAEERLKKGELKAIVATASLELGIDVGYIDLVCQLGSPRSIAVFLQRVGRSGHHLGARPKGRLFAQTRDELIESLALLRAVRRGRLDRIEPPVAPLDILAQQIVAEVSAREISEDELFALSRGAWPYRALPREEFDRVVALLSEGIAKGRREGAFLHRDGVNHVLRSRRSARLAALTSGGAIPETADYRVVTEDEGVFVGTVNEDFAVESMAGDVFLLGNTSWRVRYIRGGQVVVSDAQGAPANVPFWLGEAPGRTIELSEEISDLREEAQAKLREGVEAASRWIQSECGVDGAAALQAAAFVHAQVESTGFAPTQNKILFERFFDETGGMQLVIHSPYGVRINRAWGLALRKRFCRAFDFELQASADDNGIVLSLGVQHSFPVEQMFQMVRSEHARETLIQALLPAPMFQVRWRWNVTRALAVLRARGGRKVPPPLQRFRADDLLTAVFPLQTACFENRPPDVPLPDHPFVAQTIEDCLHEAMDIDGWRALLERVESGEVQLVGLDTREPSPFSHSILNANPYSFLDDAPLEERRARAVASRRTLSAADMRDLARLDGGAIDRVREEAWPLVRDEEELHDALLTLAALPASEGAAAGWSDWFERLRGAGRAEVVRGMWVAAERLTIAKAALESQELEDVVEVVRGRLSVAGPVTAERIARDLGLEESKARGALQTLEAEGFVLQGKFTELPLRDASVVEWCERRLLARIHRLTLEGARKAVRPVTPQTYWRFLTEHHRLLPGSRREGRLGLYEAIAQLQGFDLAASSWESDVLPARVEKYQPQWLDTLSFSGELVWGRMKPSRRCEEPEAAGAALTRVAPISLCFRADLSWLLAQPLAAEGAQRARGPAQAVYAALKRNGALFFDDVVEACGLLPSQVKDALSELAALGLVTSDGFSSLRGLVLSRPHAARGAGRFGASRRLSAGRAGRWTLFPGRVAAIKPEERLAQWAVQLLRRYGVLFRDLLTRESAAPSWWELVPHLRRLEARGEVRGGRFVSGVGGEQYALPDAVEALRRPRDGDDWLIVSAADPVNLAGIVVDGARVPSTRGNRLLLRSGRICATLQAGRVQFFEELDAPAATAAERALKLQVPALRESLLSEIAEAAKAA